MKKLISCLTLLGLLFSAQNIFAEDSNRFINELREWDFTLGGMAYVWRDSEYYFTAGIKRDLGDYFNRLPNERLYLDVGYLNSKVMRGSKEGREAGYLGTSTNANFIFETTVAGINNLLDANFQSPDLLNKVLATIGVGASKKMDSNFWNFKRGWSFMTYIDLLKLVRN